jgi:hypothetical protein
MRCQSCGREFANDAHLRFLCGPCSIEASIVRELAEYMQEDDLLPSDVYEGTSLSMDAQDDWRAQVLSERPRLSVAVRPDRGFKVFDKMGGSSWHHHHKKVRLEKGA